MKNCKCFNFCGGLSNAALLAVIKRMNEQRSKAGLPRYVDPKQKNRDVVPHGFRSSFRDWAADRTNYPNHVVDMALAHVVDDKVEAAYRRGDLFEKRRRLMRDWARYLSQQKTITREAGKVVQIGQAR